MHSQERLYLAIWHTSRDPQRQQHLLKAQGMAAEGEDRMAATRNFLKHWGSGADFDDLPAHQRAYMAARIHLIDASDPALFGDSAGLVPRLAEVAAPTLLMAGSACLPVMTAILDRMQAEIPQNSRSSIPGAGHMAPITHPAQVAAAIADHLARISP